MRTVSNGAIRGTRVGAGPAGEPYDRGLAVAKIVVHYHCANKHQTVVPFIGTVTPPPQWECRVCSQPAGADPLDPPPRAARYKGKKTHLGRVRDRRTQADGDRLMAESLARRDHPEEYVSLSPGVAQQRARRTLPV
jgi:RNA polymerase-binding protein